MEDNPAVLRLPKEQYLNRNGYDVGFTEEVADPTLAQALDRHRVALHTLEARGRPIPSFEEMQKVAEEVETPATLREKIQALQNEHLEDLRELYTCYTRDYQSDTKDLYKSYEEIRISEADERTRDLIQGWHDRLEGFCIQHQNSLYINSPLIAEFGQLRHGYLKRLLHLQKQLQDETKHESETRRRELARFPKNSSELTKFPLEAQVRVAKFLVADAKDRERMKDEFMWPSLATQPLIDEFQKDNIFNALMRATDTLNYRRDEMLRLWSMLILTVIYCEMGAPHSRDHQVVSPKPQLSVNPLFRVDSQEHEGSVDDGLSRHFKLPNSFFREPQYRPKPISARGIKLLASVRDILSACPRTRGFMRDEARYKIDVSQAIPIGSLF
ncbi:hypothetical protein MD484_g4849, partial [Candolleomyces efflorescens]